jgi:hypothetical protein
MRMQVRKVWCDRIYKSVELLALVCSAVGKMAPQPSEDFTLWSK